MSLLVAVFVALEARNCRLTLLLPCSEDVGEGEREAYWRINKPTSEVSSLFMIDGFPDAASTSSIWGGMDG